MNAKADLVSYLQGLPDDTPADELLYQTYFFQGVQAGLADIEAGRTIPQAEAKRRFEQWWQSRGHQPH